ncbi:kinase-like domain-containing protein [Dimargaris cristalligena]|uniref:non-specific serine/threonine protein kinase n=1 Tax=Dimargaris cristalligena TaxID=215637 RepID=A0A4P9ZSN8_9FUNG|nr:kinase-like domain-containing protein [Dimargaris cristalligena]|eukprot:RKP36596.1 kinase-like domain-containing protein [Dimargaris cristalligena]
MSKPRIGNYTIIKTLGTGSFGKVKLGVHSQTGHNVALKMISRSQIDKADMVGRVKREIQYLQLLRHPHIIKLYEVIMTPTDCIMVIEYAGGELFNYIVERGRMSESEARRFFQQIISAVDYCHRHKIVHRDLKPENLLLDKYDNVKIADFGLSNFMSDGEFLKTSCGSPNYAAPEVINGHFYSGPEVDVWSCGVILYVMLCGKLPFDDESIPQLFKKISSGVFSMPSYLSAEVKELLTRMLVVKPLERATITEIRQHPWFLRNLPDYLQPVAQENIDTTSQINPEIVSQLTKKLPESHSTIIAALRDPMSNPATNHIKVAYQLVADQNRIIQDLRHSTNRVNTAAAGLASPTSSANNDGGPTSNMSSPIKPPPIAIPLRGAGPAPAEPTVAASNEPFSFSPTEEAPPTVDPATHLTTPIHPFNMADFAATPLIGNTKPLLPASYQAYVQATGNVQSGRGSTTSPTQIGKTPVSIPVPLVPSNRAYPKSEASASGSKGARRPPRWHFGIRSRNPPREIMDEIFKTLKSLGIQWKPFDAWHVRCRYVYPKRPATSTANSAASPSHTAMDVDPIQPLNGSAGDIFDYSKTGGAGYQAGLVIKFDMQLYKIDSQNFLVDFNSDPSDEHLSRSGNLFGSSVPTQILQESIQTGPVIHSIFPFFYICARLITKLAA